MKKLLSLLLVALMMFTVLFVTVSCAEEVKDSTYVVTFDTGDGSEVDPVKVAPGKAVDKPANPKYDGYVFLGWFTDSEHKTEYDFETPVSSNITLYAYWFDQAVYEHCDPILPNGTGAEIPEWSKNPNGIQTLPKIIYNFGGYNKTTKTFNPVSTTNVTQELKDAIEYAQNTPGFFDETPTKVLFVFSDGWGVSSVDMSREYKGELILDYHPYASESNTDSYLKYSSSTKNNYSSKTTTDSCAGGTQVLAGYKTRYGFIALDIDANPIKNLSELARENGWKVACVTNDNIADATPADSIVHETNRYHSDIIYFKELLANDWDLLMGWDWHMSQYFHDGAKENWTAGFLKAARHGVYEWIDEEEKSFSFNKDSDDPIAFFKARNNSDKKSLAGYLFYYYLWEKETGKLNSWMSWAEKDNTDNPDCDAFTAWLDDPNGLTKAIADFAADYGAAKNHVTRFTDFKSLVNNSTKENAFAKPILGSWTSDGSDYSSSSPNRGYRLYGSIGSKYPSFPEMVAYTIYQLDAMAGVDGGFFAMIENTCTDGWGHSKNKETKRQGQMNEVQCFDEGVAIAVKYVLEHPDTLLVVTADHETGGFELRDGWETDFTQIKSTTTSHSSQHVPLYAFGAGADRFSPENIAAVYGSNPKAGVEDGGKVHEGWITGQIIGQLMGDPNFGQPANYKGN